MWKFYLSVINFHEDNPGTFFFLFLRKGKVFLHVRETAVSFYKDYFGFWFIMLLTFVKEFVAYKAWFHMSYLV
jgi:hypothetical protein